MASDFDRLLGETNARLKAARIRVVIQRRGDWLSLRATLPPKPFSLKQKPYSQRISLKVTATAEGLAVAEAEAFRLRAELIRERFDWAEWSDDVERAPDTAGEWIDKWKAHCLAMDRYRTAVDPERKWKQEEWFHGLSGLVKSEPVSKANCLHAIALKKGPRARQRTAQSLMRFAKFCGVELDLTEAGRGYSVDAIKRNVPSTELIQDCWNNFMPNSKWRNFYALMACYGLRPLEVWAGELVWLDLENKGRVLAYSVFDQLPDHRRPIDPKTGALKRAQKTKTGRRVVPPVIDGFVDFFGLQMGMELPDVKTTHGTQASRKFRIAGIPFKPYDLRHHFNFYGTTIKGHSSSTMAILLGHTVITNQRIYQRGLDGTWALKAFDAKE